MKGLYFLIYEFVDGLLKYAKCNHAGNCLVMSEILQSYLYLFGIDTKLINVKVNQSRKKINHFCLKMNDGLIIDPTASQFKDMPKVYIGDLPNNYIFIKYL